MTEKVGRPANYGLENHGLKDLEREYWNLSPAKLIEMAVTRNEGVLSNHGGLITRTGVHTGRSAKDKFTVKEETTQDNIWWGEVNVSISEEAFDRMHQKIIDHYAGKEAFVLDTTAAAHPEHKMNVRVVTEQAWHNLFARNMFQDRPVDELEGHVPDFTVLQAPSCLADPTTDETNSQTFILLNFKKKLVLIGGTLYAGEIKKSIFTALNYYLPEKDVMPMHCSATVGDDGNTALFFGLSGTGKTTLSSDPERALIGDDEHGWGPDGIFNFEGGCYAKTIRLDPDLEPLIYNASRRFGAILENVGYDETTRELDYDDGSLTENTRVSYPLNFLPNITADNRGGHPNHIFFLTADAFGVLPPISKLTPEQAYYYFVAGYTAKIAGTEKGLGKEPQATFSACFGAPFLPMHPTVYADLLKDKVSKHGAQVWLINTGWSGGGYGVGKRIHLPYTRAMVKAAMNGDLEAVSTTPDPIFGLHIPDQVPGVPEEILTPRKVWADEAAYEAAAKDLVARFHKNFAQYEDQVDENVLAAQPVG